LKACKRKLAKGVVVTERIRISTAMIERLRGGAWREPATVYVKLGTNIMGEKLVAALRWTGR
jgi:hypothetical protein